MIDAITRVGALTLADSLPKGLEQYRDLEMADRNALGALVESPESDKTIVLVFDRDPPRYQYFHLEDCMNDDPLRYLYKHGHSKGPLILPYGKVTGKKETDEDIVKTVSNRLVGWATTVRREAGEYLGPLTLSEITWLQSLADEIDRRKGELSSVVEKFQSETPGKIQLFLTLAFLDDGVERHLGAPELPFPRLFLRRNRRRMFTGDERIAICSLCSRTVAVSDRGSDLFKFSTFDQATYIAGGMRRIDAWRSFPLCEDCYRQADRGRRYIEEHLTRRVGAGPSALSYWVVPSLLNPDTDSDEARDLIALLGRQKGAGKNLSRTESKVLLTSEDDLLDDLKDLSDYLAFSLIFVEKLKARERILLTVDDVLPSRLRRLFEVKAEVETRAHRRGYLREDWEFTLYRHLFPLCEVDHGGGKTTLRRPDFLAILDHLFRGVPLEASYLAKIFVGMLRTRFVAWRAERQDDAENERRFQDTARAAWLTWNFLDGLQIIRVEGDLTDITVSSATHVHPSGSYFAWIEGFFADSARTFQSDAAKIAFLLGSLSDSVREIQLASLKSAPFVRYLKSLKMEQRDLLDLLPRITQKLTEYDEYRGRNRQMLEAVSYYLTRAGIEQWQLSSAEINLIFGMGMNLGFIARRGPGKADDASTTG